MNTDSAQHNVILTGTYQFAGSRSAKRLLTALAVALVGWMQVCKAGPSTAETAKNSGPSTNAIPAMPKPASASRRELPEALKKAVPVSISDLRAIQKHVEELVPKVSPAVVAVTVGYASGSGVIISSDGLVLTAGHVAGRPGREVRFIFPDGKTAHGQTVGVDLDADTGLMRITDPGPWPHVPVGDLEDARLGDWVLALGHPGGFDPQRSLVVRLGRIISAVPGVLQSDCIISPGDSGGPLFDMHGRVIGIHSAISTSFAENFHVPITEVYDTWKELTALPAPKATKLAQAYFGATAADDVPGCRITAIDVGSPAAKAGLKVGDRVVEANGREILASASLRRWLEETDPGETLNLLVKREGETFPLAVKLTEARKK